MRVVIVGTGIAGLVTAYRAATGGTPHDIVLVTKDELTESNTKYAQGGIAVALFPDDSVASHIDDTLVAGAGLCDRHAVEVLCGEGPQRVRDLIDLGGDYTLYDQQDKEIGHIDGRVFSIGGYWTGQVRADHADKRMMATLKLFCGMLIFNKQCRQHLKRLHREMLRGTLDLKLEKQEADLYMNPRRVR